MPGRTQFWSLGRLLRISLYINDVRRRISGQNSHVGTPIELDCIVRRTLYGVPTPFMAHSLLIGFFLVCVISSVAVFFLVRKAREGRESSRGLHLEPEQPSGDGATAPPREERSEGERSG